MGSDADLPDERPAHKVSLRPYCMDVFEVTTVDYLACSERGNCKRAGEANVWEGITVQESRAYDPVCNVARADKARHPVNCVDWSMAERFCREVGKRLPTEAEWEFAARGSDGRKYPWGDDGPSVMRLNACGAECVRWGKAHGMRFPQAFAGTDDWPTTAPVGSFPLGASQWSIEDLVGNVWEWVADFYGGYEDIDQRDPTGPSIGGARVMRGGAWNGAAVDWVRPSFRFNGPSAMRSHGVGFRCAQTR
jgi:formylglycine-generating enzyme required for sulfatase activity